MAPIRCPWPACGRVFEVADDAIGAPGACPGCGGPLTARPEAVWQRLVHREAMIAAGAPERAAPARERDPRRQRRYLYQRPPGADPRGPALRHDPMYEASSDRGEPALAPAGLVGVLDSVRSQWNVGAILRTADAAGLEGLVLTGVTATPPAPLVAKTALGAQDTVAWRYRASVVVALEELRAAGHALIALEQTVDAVDVASLYPPPRAALIIGNEVSGVSREALALCEQRVAIPMAGRKGSLNVAVAFGIAAFALARAWRSSHGDSLIV